MFSPHQISWKSENVTKMFALIWHGMTHRITFFYKGCIEGEVRIVEGSTLLEGRVEICKNNVWNTVCHGGWTVTDARVVCRQLGFSVSGEKFCRYYLFWITTYLLLVKYVWAHYIAFWALSQRLSFFFSLWALQAKLQLCFVLPCGISHWACTLDCTLWSRI